MSDPKICSICGGDYYGWGNNAWPVNDGRCCNACNNIVITHRLRQLARTDKPKKTK